MASSLKQDDESGASEWKRGWRSRLRSVSDIPSNDPVPVQSELIFKIVLVGGPQVGKSTFVKYFAEYPVTIDYMQTVGIELTIVPHGVIAGRQVYLHFYDIGSAEIFDNENVSLQMALTDASSIFFLFDATNTKTFRELDIWSARVRKVLSELPRPVLPTVVLAHKADKLTERRSCISPQDMDKFIDANGFQGWRWTSVTSRETVTDAIRFMVEASLMPEKHSARGSGVVEILLRKTNAAPYAWPNLVPFGGPKAASENALFPGLGRQTSKCEIRVAPSCAGQLPEGTTVEEIKAVDRLSSGTVSNDKIDGLVGELYSFLVAGQRSLGTGNRNRKSGEVLKSDDWQLLEQCIVMHQALSVFEGLEAGNHDDYRMAKLEFIKMSQSVLKEIEKQC
jgi:hypothetical protein|eukprot:g8286.t1